MRSVMAKAVRRDMRRAMGEYAVQQVETQTDALGAHETRITVLQDQQAQTDASLRTLAEVNARHRARIETLEHLATAHSNRHAFIARTFWTRVRWLLLGP